MGRIAGIVAFVLTMALGLPAMAAQKSGETSFERVVRTGTLRCGYNFWEPGLVFDEKNNKLWGFYYDVMQEFEKESGIKVVWDHVVDWGQVRPELEGRRIDAMCAMWNTTLESRYFLFTRPFAYQTVEAVVRAEDSRFGRDIQAADDPGVKIAVVDNATQDFIARSDFPKAQRVSSSPLASNAELLMDVQTGKADMMFTNPGIYEGYNKTNPGKLKRAAPGHNLRVYGDSLTLGLEDRELATLLNVSFGHLIDTGKIDALIDKYNKNYPGTFMKPKKDFEPANK